MKQFLLIVMASLTMLSASAQLKNPVAGVSKQVPQVSNVRQQVQVQEMLEATDTKLLLNAPKKEGGIIDGFYRRPAGAFTGFQILDDGSYGGSFYAPYLMLKPFVPYTYTALMEGMEDSQYLVWIYYSWVLNEYGEWAPESFVVIGEESIDVRYNYEISEAPKLFVAEGEGDDAEELFCYQLGGYEIGVDVTPYVGDFYSSSVIACPSFADAVGEENLDLLLSSKTFCQGGRHGDKRSMMSTFSGALPWSDNVKGWWFGKNGGRVNGLPVNGIAQAFEKPTSPYELKKVVLETAGLVVDAPVEMTCKVYRLADGIPAYDPEHSVTLPEEPGELIAKGRAIVTPETNEANDGFIIFTLYGEEDGLPYDITLTIDDAILIAIDGYNDEGMENLRDFSAMISSDYHSDEGYGELAYIKCGLPDEEGNFNGEYVWSGLNNFFSTGEMMTGLTIFIVADYPYLTFRYPDEDGEYTFPYEGGLMEKQLGGDITTRSIEFYSWVPSEDDGWSISCRGEELPEWLDIELVDGEEDGDFNNVVTAVVTAEPLPYELRYREAVVRFEFSGAYIDYKFKQGEKSIVIDFNGDYNQDGEINLADVNYLINWIVTYGPTDNDLNPNPVFGDLNGDGQINIADLNALIDIILRR